MGRRGYFVASHLAKTFVVVVVAVVAAMLEGRTQSVFVAVGGMGCMMIEAGTIEVELEVEVVSGLSGNMILVPVG